MKSGSARLLMDKNNRSNAATVIVLYLLVLCVPKGLNACMDRRPILYSHCLYICQNVSGAEIFRLYQEVHNQCYQQIRLLSLAQQFVQAVFLLRTRLNERNNGNCYEGREYQCAIHQGGSNLSFQ